MAGPAAATLLGLALGGLIVSAYFATLATGRLPALRRGLARLLGACGFETSSCVAVSQTPQARLFGGVPNAVLGLAWALALTALALDWLVTGSPRVPLGFLLVALASLVVSAYLGFSLVFVLRRPCPL